MCPTCGGILQPTSVLGFDDSLRCGTCGGLLVPNWVVNNIAEGKKVVVTALGKVVSQDNGSLSCPMDQTTLSGLSADQVPDGLSVYRCEKCSRWWFAKDSLFAYVSALDARRDYMGAWHKNELATFALPALVLVLLLTGVVGGVRIVQERQRVAIEARSIVTDIRVEWRGEIRVLEFDSSRSITSVGIKQINELAFTTYVVEMVNGRYVVDVTVLTPGEYVLMVGNDEVRFVVSE